MSDMRGRSVLSQLFPPNHAQGTEPKVSINEPQDRLELDSRLTELNRVQAWVEMLADRLGLIEETRFAIQLCLEEVLANIILHGYREQPGHPIVIWSYVSGETVFFGIEDKAPSFNPLASSEYNTAAQPASLESMEPGGNGIRLMRRFAGSIEFERLEHGNRLTMGFPMHVRNVSA